MTINILLLASGSVVVFYAIIVNRVTALLHPLRIDMAELGAFLLEAEDLPAHYRRGIEHALDSAYATMSAWIYVVALPVAFALAIRDAVTRRSEYPFSDVPTDLQADMRHFCLLSFISTIGNSPLAGGLVLIQLSVYLLLWAPMGQLIRESMKTTFTIEEASAQISANLHGLRHAAQ
jgi:hypothetical protein